jgi:hypothetical protein
MEKEGFFFLLGLSLLSVGAAASARSLGPTTSLCEMLALAARARAALPSAVGIALPLPWELLLDLRIEVMRIYRRISVYI